MCKVRITVAPGTANLTLHSEANVRCFLVIANEAKVAKWLTLAPVRSTVNGEYLNTKITQCV